MNFFDTHLDEKVQDTLAQALVDVDPKYRSQLVQALAKLNIDFNKSVDDATIIKSSRDPKFKSPDNIIIGVYQVNVLAGQPAKLGLSVYSPKYGYLVDPKNVDVIDRKGQEIGVEQFSKLSKTKWIKCMIDTYVIDMTTAVKLDSTRQDKLNRRVQSSNKSLSEVTLEWLDGRIRSSKSGYKVGDISSDKVQLVPTLKGYGLPVIDIEKSGDKVKVTPGTFGSDLYGVKFDIKGLRDLKAQYQKYSDLLVSISTDPRLNNIFE